jgi:hypothetical protein
MSLKSIGYYILIISIALLVGNGIYKLFEEIIYNSELTLIYKVSITGIIVGIIVLLIGLIKERRGEDKNNDNY